MTLKERIEAKRKNIPNEEGAKRVRDVANEKRKAHGLSVINKIEKRPEKKIDTDFNLGF